LRARLELTKEEEEGKRKKKSANFKMKTRMIV
jgi:hypothetical protein